MSATAPLTQGSRPPYRPALDGLRAVAIIGVLVFHLNPAWLRGGWVGVDLFFVLSGFLITTLIIREQNRTGNLRLLSFWAARMRRLLPALISLLFAVVLLGWIFTIDSRRQAVSYDIFAALGYVANWRFIFGDEGYFANLLLPSPVRHTWSLSIEEQFYVFLPLLIVFLGFVSTKRIVHAAVLGFLAFGSAALMFLLYTPGIDPVRVYFGTDTRAFELLIGATGAIVLRKQSFEGFISRTRLVHGLAWIGLFLVVTAMVSMPENSAVPYRGGLVVLCLGAFAAILGAASSPDTIFSKVLSFPPIRWIGLISYPLYLWHWPIIVFFDGELLGLGGPLLALVQASLSILLAWGTYRLIEKPIRERRAFLAGASFPSKILIVAAIPTLILCTLAFGKSASPFQTAQPVAGNAQIEPLDVTASRAYTSLIFGNSIPLSLARSVQEDAHPYIQLSANAFIGCEPFEGITVINRKDVLPSPECIAWRKAWPGAVASSKPDILVYFVSQSFVNDVRVDNNVLRLGTAAHDDYIVKSLDQTRKTALASGARSFGISNLACHNMPAYNNDEMTRLNNIKVVKHINKLAYTWAKKYDVLVIDSFTALCPNDQYSESLNGVKLYGDGLHFTPESGPIFWSWMAPQLIAYLESQS